MKPLGSSAWPGVVPGWWIRVASVAAALTVAGWLLAPAIRELLQSSFVVAADSAVAAWLHARTSPALTEFMRWQSVMHGTAGILTLTAIVAAMLWRYGERQDLPILLAAVPGGMLLNVAIKHAVRRVRPDWVYALEALESFSFPSGHTAGATLFYGATLAWLWPRTRAAWMRIALAVAAAGMVLLVAASRIVLGLHFLSDCVAAVFEALLWLAICMTRAERREP